MQEKKYKGIVTISALVCLLISIVVFAEETNEYKLLVGLPEMAKGTAPGLGGYLQNMFKIGISIAGVLAVLMITIGGVQYMTAEAISGKGEAKKKINNAIFGLILALSSFLLLNEIDPNLTTSTLTLENVEAPPVVPPGPGPEPEEVYLGMCKSGMSCGGDTLSTCESACANECSTEIIMSPKCTKNWLGDKYEGKCIAIDDAGNEYSTPCGKGTISAEACLTACKSISSACAELPQMMINCHKQ
ncbi:MAG: pilin [Patescibacteria group bacterium]|nr:pilin [Patescibacteria group bacterium]